MTGALVAPTAAVISQIPVEPHIPPTASYALLVALETHLTGIRADLAGSTDTAREVHLARVDAYLDALRAELDRRYATRAERNFFV